MSEAPRWSAGAPDLRASIERWLEGGAGAIAAGEWRADGSAQILSESPQRRLVRLQRVAGSPVLIKIFRTASGPHRVRERFKRALGLAAPDREWRGLCWLGERRVPAPEPLARARLANGDALLVLSWIDAESLWEKLESDPSAALATLPAVGELVRQLHAAGLAHGDLHPGNLLLGPEGPLLVDLQRLRRARSGTGRQRADLARLDFSLALRDVPETERRHLLCVALALRDPTSAQSRRKLARVARASQRAAQRHRRRREREACRQSERGARSTP